MLEAHALYIGQTLKHFSKHRYAIKNRSDKSELAKHHHINDDNHYINDNFYVTILQNNIKLQLGEDTMKKNRFVD